MSNEVCASIDSVNSYRARYGKPPLSPEQKRVLTTRLNTGTPQRQERKAPSPPTRKTGGRKPQRHEPGAVPKKPYRKKTPRPDRPEGAGKKRGHWFPVSVSDLWKIKNNQSQVPYGLVCAVWIELLTIASAKRSLSFEASDNFLAGRVPGASTRRTIRKATAVLESLGMLQSESGLTPGTKERMPLKRTLFPSGSFFRATCPDGLPDQTEAEPDFS